MSEEMIIRHCSPTLAGMKTGSIFTCEYTSKDSLKENIRKLNRTLGKKGLRVLPLRFHKGRALIYVFRPTHLSRDLRHDTAARLLSQRGYVPDTPDHCVNTLIDKLEQSKDFPHEIGLFLGYPPEDVSGFIENNAHGYKLVGPWKVYGDEDAARKLFAKYKKCTDIYSEQYAKGKSIERLTVVI
ncbi:MAG: DUF3793 family protein [Clostridia bacterium]|nr:DUF3793 family protein [Clostridia bacterium]